MPKLFDTHAHFEGSADQIAAVLNRAFEAGVGFVMAIGGSDALNAGAIEAAGGRPNVAMALGWDRDQLNRDYPEIDYTNVAAIGEIGLDYHYSPETRQRQVELLSRQLELARRLDKPVVIHTREADDDTLGILREIPSRGIIHSFTGSPQFCKRLLDLGFYVSMSGIVTFRQAENVRETARVIPNERLLIETDSPYLAPVPMRGRENEPAFLVHTAKFLSDMRQMPFGDFAELTTNNAFAVLNLAHIRERK